MSHESSVHDDLAAIRGLMNASQRLVSGTWWHQLIWGLLVAAGLTLTWVGERFGRYELIWAVWPTVILLGWTFSIVRGRREHARGEVRNVASRAFAGLWIGLGVTLTLTGMLTIPTGAVAPDGLPGILGLILGSGYFATGFITGMRWLTIVAVGWWIGGGLLLVFQSPASLLGLAALTVALEVIPALALRRMERRSGPLY